MPQDDPGEYLRRESYFVRDWQFFDLIIGNPPFGGSIDGSIQDALDAIYGWRYDEKIKKETYSFFVVKACDLLKPCRRLLFICSDTFLTINTMRGLRNFLMESGRVEIRNVPGYFDETNHPMVLLDFTKSSAERNMVIVFGEPLEYEMIARTENLSWRIDKDLAKYFSGKILGDFITATSGMTIGNNELFLRKIENGTITEKIEFEFFEDRITLEHERARARLHILSPKQVERIHALEQQGATKKNVRWRALPHDRVISLPHPDYRYYNKANNRIVYADSEWAIFWKDDGDAVYTFKKNGNWYLHGVGGRPFFGRSGLTWSLIASRVYTKCLPAGHILDSGAPTAFVREDIDEDEAFFIMGWTLTEKFNEILKRVINHTRNIQGKDVERMPYPVWVGPDEKREVVGYVKELIESTKAGRVYEFGSPEIKRLDEYFCFRPIKSMERSRNASSMAKQMALF